MLTFSVGVCLSECRFRRVIPLRKFQFSKCVSLWIYRASVATFSFYLSNSYRCMYVYLFKPCAYSVLFWRVNVCVCFFFLFDRLNYSNGEKGASSVYTEKASIYLYNVCNSLAWRLHHHLFLWKSNHSCSFFILFRLLSILFCAFHQATRIHWKCLGVFVCVWKLL